MQNIAEHNVLLSKVTADTAIKQHDKAISSKLQDTESLLPVELSHSAYPVA